MATPPTTALTKGERTRLRLLEAAEKVFGAHGFHAASISDLTREADVAMGTFYVYFPSKRDILAELVRTRGHELRTELHEATKDLTNRADIERVGFETFFDWVRRHPEIYRVVRNAEFVDAALLREWYEKLAAEYARGLSRAIAKGEVIDADPEALAYCLMAIGDFTGMRWVLWPSDSKIPKKVMDTVMGFISRGLGMPPGPTPNGAGQRRSAPIGGAKRRSDPNGNRRNANRSQRQR